MLIHGEGFASETFVSTFFITCKFSRERTTRHARKQCAAEVAFRATETSDPRFAAICNYNNSVDRKKIVFQSKDNVLRFGYGRGVGKGLSRATNLHEKFQGFNLVAVDGVADGALQLVAAAALVRAPEAVLRPAVVRVVRDGHLVVRQVVLRHCIHHAEQYSGFLRFGP